MKRRTRIICTLGPASETFEVISKLADAGMDIARINFSHGDEAGHQKLIDHIRAVNIGRKNKVRILQDLQGYRIRLGLLKVPVELKNGQMVGMVNHPTEKVGVLPLDAKFDLKSLKPGMDIFVADGMIALRVAGPTEDGIKLEVIRGGLVSSKKGVNIPDLKLMANIFTEKDRQDIDFGIRNSVDFIAQSFVRNKGDIQQVVAIVKPRLPQCKVIAKIENKDGVKNIDSILRACDGVMVARGDMGVSLPIFQVPIIQKNIIRRSNLLKKMDITATQMLESMTEHFLPTRAEVSDVANAILDRSDCVMLSAETAVGKFPVESVVMMRQIIEYTEQNMKSVLSPQR